ncbi:ATP-dependent DNA helicase [Trichonephila clavipes]|nr:ATP-dependent DNA helicase [Trichonephila clavipes]
MDEIVNLGHRLPCSWCRALKWKDETQGMCCSGGKVQLPTLEPYPEPLHSLLTHQNPLSEHFLFNYSIGSLMAGAHQKPSFLQIYFIGDDHREKDIRCGIYPGIKPELISQLQKSLHEHNKYIMDFKAAINSVPKDQKEFKVVINAERKPFGEHKGRFTAPQTKEVAVVIVGQEFEKRDIVFSCRSGTLMRINETHRVYDALQYLLMFFCGKDGYQINIPKRHETTKIPLSKTVSASVFYSYRIMERHGEDAITANDGQLSELGTMVVLPSSFTGGSRYMHERTQDAMTYVRHFERPDLFITLTCNPKWSEIVDLLNQGQKSHDRHDVIARVFRVKVKHMMRLLTKGCIFGNVRCHMYTVEWQKRGLPHIHILLWLKEKIRPESIDKVICAELPDSKLDPALYEIIRTTMIHGPCRHINPSSPCILNGNCTKKISKVLPEGNSNRRRWISPVS